jgi:transposase
MAEPLVSDELWAVVGPLIPKHVASQKGGRPRLDDRKVLTGILFILKSGIPGKCFRRRWVAEVECRAGEG